MLKIKVKMLNIEAKEFIPKNEYMTNWDNNEKNLLKEFNINNEDIDWKNIECDIHLMNLDQNYENFMENINNYLEYLIDYDKKVYGGVNITKIKYDYMLKINEASGYHNLYKINIMKKYMC